MAESNALRKIIARGRAGEITYAEWSVDVDASDADAVAGALGDRGAWLEGNPSLGSLITEEFIGTVERSNLTDAEFARERLGIFPDPDNGLGPQWSVIAEADWSSCRSGESGRRAGAAWVAGRWCGSCGGGAAGSVVVVCGGGWGVP
ncbi:MAG: hypothetical protein IPG97_15815 [Microthrixaceae bacterium]|nr:hypothetical protein [Microthrixaceae bacterium]